jgi:serine/threonine protein kinase
MASGAFGTVYKGKHKRTKFDCAVKVVKKRMVKSREIHEELMKNELEVLEEMNHPHIV